MTGTEKRAAALDRIRSYVCSDRQNAYGDAEDNFRVIADYWNIYLGEHLKTQIKSHDIAAMMALMKIARLKTSPFKQDNWDDLAGYAVCGSGIVQREEEKASTTHVYSCAKCLHIERLTNPIIREYNCPMCNTLNVAKPCIVDGTLPADKLSPFHNCTKCGMPHRRTEDLCVTCAINTR